jgi:hypothetical protein
MLPLPTYIGIDPSKRMYTPSFLFGTFWMFSALRGHMVPYRETTLIASFFLRLGIGYFLSG